MQYQSLNNVPAPSQSPAPYTQYPPQQQQQQQQPGVTELPPPQPVYNPHQQQVPYSPPSDNYYGKSPPAQAAQQPNEAGAPVVTNEKYVTIGTKRWKLKWILFTFGIVFTIMAIVGIGLGAGVAVRNKEKKKAWYYNDYSGSSDSGSSGTDYSDYSGYSYGGINVCDYTTLC